MCNALEAREFSFAGTVNQSAYTWLLQDGSHRASYVVVQGSLRVFQKTQIEAGKLLLTYVQKACSITLPYSIVTSASQDQSRFKEKAPYKYMNHLLQLQGIQSQRLPLASLNALDSFFPRGLAFLLILVVSWLQEHSLAPVSIVSFKARGMWIVPS